MSAATKAEPTFSPLRIATLNAIQAEEFDLNRVHPNWSMNLAQCFTNRQTGRDHVRPVKMVATPAGWECPDCGREPVGLIFPLGMVDACEREYCMTHSVDCRDYPV